MGVWEARTDINDRVGHLCCWLKSFPSKGLKKARLIELEKRLQCSWLRRCQPLLVQGRATFPSPSLRLQSLASELCLSKTCAGVCGSSLAALLQFGLHASWACMDLIHESFWSCACSTGDGIRMALWMQHEPSTSFCNCNWAHASCEVTDDDLPPAACGKPATVAPETESHVSTAPGNSS